MTLTIDPATEACRALVDRIESGSYSLGEVCYSDQLSDSLESMKYPRVDVITEDEETLDETLAIEDRTSHQIRVWIRSQARTQQDIEDLKLLTRQIYEQLNNWDSDDGRVKVWECGLDQKQNPDKDVLRNTGLFKSFVLLRVEVEPSA